MKVRDEFGHKDFGEGYGWHKILSVCPVEDEVWFLIRLFKRKESKKVNISTFRIVKVKNDEIIAKEQLKRNIVWTNLVVIDKSSYILAHETYIPHPQYGPRAVQVEFYYLQLYKNGELAKELKFKLGPKAEIVGMNLGANSNLYIEYTDYNEDTIVDCEFIKTKTFGLCVSSDLEYYKEVPQIYAFTQIESRGEVEYVLYPKYIQKNELNGKTLWQREPIYWNWEYDIHLQKIIPYYVKNTDGTLDEGIWVTGIYTSIVPEQYPHACLLQISANGVIKDWTAQVKEQWTYGHIGHIITKSGGDCLLIGQLKTIYGDIFKFQTFNSNEAQMSLNLQYLQYEIDTGDYLHWSDTPLVSDFGLDVKGIIEEHDQTGSIRIKIWGNRTGHRYICASVLTFMID